jgi:hypothetical protein
MTTYEFTARYLDSRNKLIDTKAAELGKSRCDLIPWADYDPIQIDYEATVIARGPGIYWAGD